MDNNQVCFLTRSDTVETDDLFNLWSLEKLYVVCGSREFPGIGSSNKIVQKPTREVIDAQLSQISQSLAEILDWKSSFEAWKSLYCKYKQIDTLPTPIQWRVTIRRAGVHNFSTEELITPCVQAIESSFPTNVAFDANLKDYQLEIFLYFFFDRIFVCFTVSDECLCLKHLNQNDLTGTSLRPSIAYSLISIANVQESEIVTDICCGTATIPIVLRKKASVHSIGVDIEESQLEIAKQKIGLALEPKDYPTLVLGNFQQLPFRDKSIDVVISNLPFGIQIGSHSQNRTSYPLLFRELSRVLKWEGRAILLTTETKLVTQCIKQLKYVLWLKEKILIW